MFLYPCLYFLLHFLPVNLSCESYEVSAAPSPSPLPTMQGARAMEIFSLGPLLSVFVYFNSDVALESRSFTTRSPAQLPVEGKARQLG
jgi:hypothetical protein